VVARRPGCSAVCERLAPQGRKTRPLTECNRKYSNMERMNRRLISAALFAAAAGSVAPRSAVAQTCTPNGEPHTAAEIAAGVVPTNTSFAEGDVRRYGASTASPNNSPSFAKAFSVSAAGGNAVFVPGGTWQYTAALIPAGNCSMVGCGALSILSPQGCDGIHFPAWAPPQPAVRVFRDFHIIGTSTSTRNGISTTVSPSAVFGVNFTNIGIQNFSAAIFLNGFRTCGWTGIAGDNNYYGIYLIGQNTSNRFVACNFLRGTIAGSGGAWGMSLQASIGLSTQGTQAIGCYFYNYDIGINLILGLETQIDNCDISACTTTGVSVSTVLGGFWLTNCWVETFDSSATIGALVAPQRVGNNFDIHINSNHFNCDTPNSGSIGLSIPGANQNGVVANDNQFVGWATGISNVAGTHLVAKFNRFVNNSGACVLLNSVSATDNEIGPNFVVESGAALAFTGRTTPTGLAYFGRGSFPASLTGMSNGGSGTISWSADGHIVTLSVPDNSIVGTSDASTMSLTGLPEFLWPSAIKNVSALVIDAGVGSMGFARIGTAGKVSFSKDLVGTSFTASGTKGIGGFQMTYPYT
jgi:hypothetical protein